MRADRLYVQRFNTSTLMLEGGAAPIAQGVVVDAAGIAAIPATGGEASTIFDGPSQEIPVDWSRDGRYILYRAQEVDGSIDLWALPMDGERQPFPVSEQPNANERFGQISPNGKWVAFESNESGRYEVYVQAFPKPGGKVVVSTAGGRQARWSKDGNELFYVAPDARLIAVFPAAPYGRSAD